MKHVKFINKTSNLNNSYQTLELNNLYSREQNGECVGKYNYNFSDKTVLICEGHYTSRTEFFNLIDLNICLLCEKDELLKRKVERVKTYRSSKDAIDYFWKIDVPSFSFHIARFSKCVDYFIDNTDFLNPRILPKLEVRKWIKLNKAYFKELYLIDYKDLNFFQIYKRIFSNSEINKILSINQFKLILDFYKSIDKIIRRRLQENINQYEKGIKESLDDEINKLKIKVNNDLDPKLKILASSNSSLYDVYNRKIPVNFGISVIADEKNINFNFTIYMYKCEVIIFWDGGAYELTIERSLSDIKENRDSIKFNFKSLNIKSINKFDNQNINEIKLYTPTDFCIPEFIKDYKVNKIFTGREQETTLIIEILKKIIGENNTVLSHRLSINSEIKFYLSLLNTLGIPSLKVSNYIVALNTQSSKLVENYKSWTKNWISSDNNESQDEKKYDQSILDEIYQAEEIISSNSKKFYILDSFLFSKESDFDELEIEELSMMLNSENRSLRKRAFQYILNQDPNIEIDVSTIFECYEINNISLQSSKFQVVDLPRIYPSIMAEIYLWQHLRGDKSGILGANVYDIDKNNSLDINGLLKSSINKNTAIIFQSSFNAMGQKEMENNNKYEGYLKLKNGPRDLVDACICSVIRSVFVNKTDFPIYGIGGPCRFQK